MVSEDSGRRRFIRRLTTLGAAGGIATLLYGRATEKPLIQLAQAASGDYLSMDSVNTAAGTTELDSNLATSSSGASAFKVVASATSGSFRGIYAESAADNGTGVYGVAIATTGSAGMELRGVYGEAKAAGGTAEDGPWPHGVKGYASGTSGATSGVYGRADSPDGVGVFGWGTATTGNAFGIAGMTYSPEGFGAYARNYATSGVDIGMTPHGVYGQVDANGGTWADGPRPRGVEGYAAGSSGAGSGVYGHSDSPDADGVTGIAPNSGVYGEASSQNGRGIWGLASATSADPGLRPTGVYGEAYANGGTFPTGPFPAGVEGYASGASGLTTGVYGHVVSPDGAGVGGVSEASSGWGAGVAGFSYSLNGYGVWGEATATSSGPGMSPTGVYGQTDSNGGSWDTGPWPHGVEGYARGTNGATHGVFGRAESPDGAGVVGLGLATTGYANGVVGQSNSPDGTGVVGFAGASSGNSCGVYGEANSAHGVGVVGRDLAADYGNCGVYGEARVGAGVQGDAQEANGIGVLGHAQGPSVRPIIAWATSGQTASLQEWVALDWTPLAVVDAAGQFGIGTATPARQLHIVGSNAVARLDRNVDSASFIFVRTNTDYSQVLKTFTFGVKATGVNNGSFFIGDMHTNVSGSSDNRLLIDTNGNVGIGTTTPSSKLHVAGRVKAQGYDTGDITFANSYSVTEDETAGLAFKNDTGQKIAVLDREGNWHIKGKFISDL